MSFRCSIESGDGIEIDILEVTVLKILIPRYMLGSSFNLMKDLIIYTVL